MIIEWWATIPDNRCMNIIRRALGAQYCPFRLPWFYEAESLWELNRRARLEDRRIRTNQGLRGEMLLATALWPLASFLQSVKRTLGRQGADLRKVAGVGRVRQLVDQLWLANRYNIGARPYFLYRLWEPERRAMVGNYVFNDVFRHLQVMMSGDDRLCLNDKLAFHRRCVEHGIPTVPMVAHFKDGAVMEWFAPRLPEKDLFAKPLSASKGDGAELWRWTGAGWSRGGRTLDEEGLVAHFSKSSEEDEHLLMERVSNHPAMAHLTSGGLATLRLVTCRGVDRPAWRLLSVMRMPVGDAEVDNMAAGGIAAAVGESGRLGPALGKDFRSGVMTRHPTTGGEIAGTELPMWQPAVDLCVSAHEAFPEMASVGWDVAITAEGPIIIEGNGKWCVELAQIPANSPVGTSPFAEWACRSLRSQGEAGPSPAACPVS